MHILLGEQLEMLCAQVNNRALLVAPFVKEYALKRIFNHIGPNIEITVVTRWNPIEIISGVSDIEVWPLVKERKNTSLLLCSHLHAKYFKLDNICLVGSANLTGRALGWNRKPNLELLVEVDYQSGSLREFEKTLFSNAITVNDTIYHQTIKAVSALSKPTKLFVNQETTEEEQPNKPLSGNNWRLLPATWLPTTRYPENLFKAYCGESENLTRASRASTALDLTFLELPEGLSSESFNLYVGAMLLQSPLISKIDKFLKKPQRFGAVANLLMSLPCANSCEFDANYAWQTLIRWFGHFLPGRYAKVKSDYSEVLMRINKNT